MKKKYTSLGGNDDEDDDDGVESDTESFGRREKSTLSAATAGDSANVSTTVYVGPGVTGRHGTDEVIHDTTNTMEIRIPRTTNNWDKFCLLMWKNFLLQWRHKLQGVIEILVPVLFSALLVLIRYLVEPTVYDQPTHYTPFAIDSLDPIRQEQNAMKGMPVIEEWKVAYSPRNPHLDDLVRELSSALELTDHIAADNATELEGILVTKKILCGIEFQHPANITSLPKNLRYALRFPSESRAALIYQVPMIFNWHTGFLFPLYSTGGPRNHKDNAGGMVFYDKEGFLTLQYAIAQAYIKLQSGDKMPSIQMQRYPYPKYIFDILLEGLEAIVPFVIMLSFVYSTINTVKFIATEKEKQLKEAMKIMGLPNWLHWTGWFVKSMIFSTLSISLIVFLLKTTWSDSSVSVFTHSNWATIWLFMFIFSISMTTYGFMLSVFFSKANSAAAVAGLVWFILYVPFSFTQQNYENLSFTTKILICLSSNTAMAYGFQIILRFEGIGEGLQWSNIFQPVSIDDKLTMGHIIFLLLFTSSMYLIVTLYVEKVFPGSFGVAQHWYFPFTKEFWFPAPAYVGIEDSSFAEPNSHDRKNFETDPKGRCAGIQIKGLRKMYPNKKVAVQGLNINMFDDQITVLLGHNGAGKTTTMSMLTGMFPPTDGTALINGCDIRNNIHGARQSMGLCPQHNILFDELTVREHIVFYSRMKGLEANDIEEEVQKYVKLLDLVPKIDAQSHTLSGGMKRKLSVGVALCGRSKVVLCDEPSSGMDPSARRALWDVLQAEKKGRTILLSTHFMDEADILGDRIAIMADGQLKCYGSSFFLKKRYGTGYHLICVKANECVTADVTELIRKYLPGIDVESDIGTELSYQLPEERVSVFQKLLAELEECGDSLGLASYGISLTTLEEVFMKVGTDNLLNVNGGTAVSNGSAFLENGDAEQGNAINHNMELIKGPSLMINQWIAMFKKKYLYSTRNWILFLLQNIIPISFIIISVLVSKSIREQSGLPPLEIDLNVYHQSVTVIDKSIPFEPNSLMARIGDEYEKYFHSAPERSNLVVTNDDFSHYILGLGDKYQIRINAQYLAGVSIGRANETNAIVAWFNNQPFHTAPLALNLVHNAMVRAMVGPDHSIQVINKPIPFTINSRINFLEAGNNIGFQLASNLGFAMAFVAAFYIMFYIKERECKAKLLQFVSGVNVFTFWMTSFLWDYFTYFITTILLVITLALFQEDGWSTPAELGRTLVVFLLFGFAMLPMTFLAAKFFTIPSSGFTRMTMINIFTGIAIFIVVFTMSIPKFDLTETAETLKRIFMVFPHFSLSTSLNNLNIASTMGKVCKSKCDLIAGCTEQLMCMLFPECCEIAPFAWKEPGIGRTLTYFACTGLTYFVVLLVIEYRLFDGIVYAIRGLFHGKLPNDDDVDQDVLDEKQRVNAMSPEERECNSLVLNQVSKFYSNFLAVNQISIGIQHSECFGLLGINGAGKTSTFRMLTGDSKISSGEAWVRGISLKTNMNTVHQMIGYCPQFDAILEDLTGRETLEIFCLLRGVRRSEINSLSLRLANDLNFIRHIDKKVGEYSGGNKRKLSTALALIGNPAVVYLDEPTTGMDPGAKRHLWNVICKVRNSGKSIVLTSHSMEECEALCTRLAIMVNGEFKCLGSTQYLKNKFSNGYVLSVKVRRNMELPSSDPSCKAITEIVNVKNFIASNFAGANLKEEHNGMLTYYVPPSDDLKWSTMFGLMEKGKKSLNIEDYSLSQTSLEQVFLSLTKFQRAEARDQSQTN